MSLDSARRACSALRGPSALSGPGGVVGAGPRPWSGAPGVAADTTSTVPRRGHPVALSTRNRDERHGHRCPRRRRRSLPRRASRYRRAALGRGPDVKLVELTRRAGTDVVDVVVTVGPLEDRDADDYAAELLRLVEPHVELGLSARTTPVVSTSGEAADPPA